ncbi:MAG TPA: pyridoxal-phosphate dependent enzyme, partial [Gemmatimonadales bacterium]|nr:pyridoxal-phosphate dependent enzyme [Gemmatimonadales bacterium]
MPLPWTLVCSRCNDTRDAGGLPGVCPHDGAPYLVKYPGHPPAEVKSLLKDRRRNMWRYREWLPLADGEQPITLGEGGTPLLPLGRLGKKAGFEHLFVKDEGLNPTGSFKARGLAAAVTRAVLAGASRFVVPTAGNAGVSLAAYATRAGVTARVYAPASTPRTILSQIQRFGADLQLIDGHIGDCGKAARAYAAETGAVDVSTLREPYRIEGKKTLGLE